MITPIAAVPVAADTVTETVATAPLKMLVLFIPVAMQVKLPELAEHVIDLLAEVRA